MTPMDAGIMYYVAGFISKIMKKAVTCIACGDIVGENSALEINIEGIIPENCQLFVDEINRGGLVKPSDLVYAICTAWNTFLIIQISFLSSKAHRSVFLNIVQRQAIESSKYVDILDTICLKNDRFGSLLSNTSVSFSMLYAKTLFQMCIHKKSMKIDDKPNKQ